ncbi:cytochrome c [Psychrobacter phenylpyruvicus]|uniref:Cytochrome c552 n=1 Tax=Psychrobacter phenylpyruvicus TaxID=29432 RepID=A0A379LPY2_9GAMM|nr:c-type cytochrome [Psychrobacter phenylpyruvicus]SUD92135.1 Cytochrome c552 [Psychrobacter phenylpyruvicus]
MKYFKAPSLTPLSMVLIGSTLGLLTGCSSQSDDTVTLAQTSDTFTGAPVQQEVDPYASRNNGAWGGVYMTESELNDNNRHIVDIDAVPPFDQDPSLEKWNEKFGYENAYVSTDGKKLYHDSCAGCHMHEGEGAYGAGYYPPLANNSKMQSKYYIIDILINGLRGMPSFRHMMNDEQIAAVTEYVVKDLNGFDEEVTAEDVAQLRPTTPPAVDPAL